MKISRTSYFHDKRDDARHQAQPMKMRIHFHDKARVAFIERHIRCNSVVCQLIFGLE